jgi:GAF domain-containing protein
MADRLQASLSEMERRVADRTRELETITAELAGRSAELEEAHARQLQVNRQLEEAVGQSQRRALLLQASTEVSRAMAQIHDMDRLLSQVTQLISERFNVYHCGIFLIDPANRCAVLRAANSDGGQRLVAQQHKLGVGSEGIVGYVTDTGKHRIALDIGEDAFFFNNPELPDTRSELASPLRVGDKIIGALDVQSVEQAAFEDEDVAVLTSLADQIAIAIENARLFQQSRAALEEARRVQQRYVQQQWLEYTRQQTTLAYEYTTLSGVNPVDAAPGPEIRGAWRDGRLILLDSDGRLENTANGKDGNPSRATLAVPVQVHGEPIGLLELQESDGEHVWTDDEIALVQAVADQLGQTLESARLFEQMQASLAETQTLFQTSRSLAAAQEIEDVWQAITDAARQRNTDACGLFLFDSRQRETAREIILVAGWDEQQPSRLNVGVRLPIGGLDVFDTMHPDRPFTVTDLTQAASIDEDTRNLLDALGFTAALLQPIAVRGRWFGLLAVFYRSSHEFTSAESDFFRTLTDQAALAFEGQRLLAETQRRAQREQLIRQITDKVRATSDLDTILQTTVQELSIALGVPRAFVRLGVQEDMAPSHSVETARSGPASPPAEGITDE